MHLVLEVYTVVLPVPIVARLILLSLSDPSMLYCEMTFVSGPGSAHACVVGSDNMHPYTDSNQPRGAVGDMVDNHHTYD